MAATQPVPEIRANARREVLHDPSVQKEAARLRVITDARQGKTTPQWVRQLADDAASRVDPKVSRSRRPGPVAPQPGKPF